MQPKTRLKIATRFDGFLPTPAFVMSSKEGNPHSEIVFVSEERDSKADELLTKMIEAMGMNRKDVFITNSSSNITKISKPKVIVALGKSKDLAIFNEHPSIDHLRGKILDHEGIQLIVTHHPSQLLVNPALKKVCWEDLQLAMKILGLNKKN